MAWNWREWVGKAISLKDGAYWAEYYSLKNSAQKVVNQETILSVAAAWACIKLLSTATGILPITLYRKNADGGRDEVTDHPVYDLVHESWNGEFPSNEGWEAVVANLAGHGNAFAFRRGFGSTPRLDLIPWDDMQVTRNAAGALRYSFPFRGKSYTDMTARDVIHWRGFGFGGDLGLSAIRYGANTLGIAMAGDDTAGKMFANGAFNSGFIETDRVLDKDQRKQWNETMASFRNDDSPGKLMLLEAGFKFNGNMSINFDDLQLLQSRGLSIEQVCSLFGVPPFMIGHTEKNTSWGSGLEQQLIGFLTFGLMPYLNKIAKRNNLFLLSPGDRASGLYTEFNVEGLLRADSAARAAFISAMVQNGIYTRGDFRRKENLPRAKGDDILTVQANLVPLDMVGQLPAGGAPAEQVRQALIAWLGVPPPEA